MSCCSSCANGGACASGGCNAQPWPPEATSRITPPRVNVPAAVASRSAALMRNPVSSSPLAGRAVASSPITSGTLSGQFRTGTSEDGGSKNPPRSRTLGELGGTSSRESSTTSERSTREDPNPISADDARRWVDSGLDFINDRFAEGDRAAQREHLQRMAELDFQNNRDEREYRLKLAEIENRFRGTTQGYETTTTTTTQTSDTAAIGLGVLGLGLFAWIASRAL